ncbi:MAG TPA: EB domain-containing protein, partial [Myxococcales bacterium]|nr:EB domain-containing protein [Myxococcales bacterium]
MKTLLLLLLVCACLPRPGGRCASDADCLGGLAGSICAESVCQAPLQGSLEALPARAFGRGETLHVRVRVQHAHGLASARVTLGGQPVEAAFEIDGALGAMVPLSLAPAGVEGPVPLSVELRDDLGHALTFPASVTVDDRPPRIAFDTITSAAVLRGTRLSLHITAADLTAVAIDGASANPDGSFTLPIDTGGAPPGASSMTVTANATDAAGNHASVSTRVSLTRLKYFVPHPTVLPVGSLVLADSRILATAGQN